MIKKTLTAFFILISIFSSAKFNLLDYKTQNQDKIANTVNEKYKEIIQDEPEKNLPLVVKELTGNTKDPFLKVKRIFDWISLNIIYDLEAYNRGTTKYKEEPYLICLRTGKSVCEGYAELFSKMCKLAQIENKTITGYSRGLGANYFSERQHMSSNHKWNAVKIEQKWYLADPTWGSGYIENGTYIKRYSSFFLFAKPEELIYSHFPNNPYNQMLEKQYDKHKFLLLPFFNQHYFDEKISIKNKLHNGMNLTDPSYSMEISYPIGKGVNVACFDSRGRQVGNNVFIQQRTDSSSMVNIRFPRKSRYVIQIFEGKIDESRKRNCASVMVYAQKSNKQEYPISFQEFFSKKCYLESPMQKNLKKNQLYSFNIHVPEATELLIKIGDKRVKMKKSGENFTKSIKMDQKGDLVVFAKFPNQTQYAGLLKYEVK